MREEEYVADSLQERHWPAKEAYLDVLDATSFDGIEAPVFQHSGTVGGNGNSRTIFIFELRSFENLE